MGATVPPLYELAMHVLVVLGQCIAMHDYGGREACEKAAALIRVNQPAVTTLCVPKW